MIKARPLHRGATIGIVGPSGPRREGRPDYNAMMNAIDKLGFRAVVADNVRASYGYLAGTDAQRAEGVNRMFRDDRVDAAIFLIDGDSDSATHGKALVEPDIAAYGLMNPSALQRRVILKKADEANAPLAGATFEILRYDRTKVSGTDINGATTTAFASAANGVYFVGQLPFGLYYLHETAYPSGMKQNGTDGWWYTLKVDPTGVQFVGDNKPHATPLTADAGD